MATISAKAFRVTETSRPILQCFVQEQIPADTIYMLASSEGYLFFNEEIPMRAEGGNLRIPKLSILSYYEIEYDSE